MSESKTHDWMLEGVQAVAMRRGYGFVLEDECNFCTRQRIRELFGPTIVADSIDGTGVEVLVHGVPLVWFDATPKRCTCNL